MPGLSGEEVVTEIRSNASESKESFVMLCTANVLVKQQKQAVLKQVDALLIKPFREEEVRAVFAKNEKHHSVVDKRTYNLAGFSAFAGDDEAMLKTFITSFIENSEQSIEHMEAHLKSQRYAEMGEEAHKLKNTFSQLEAISLVADLKTMEGWIAQKHLPFEEAQMLFTDFKTKAKKLFSALAEEKVAP